MTSGDEPAGGLGAGRRSAARFFWAWLIVATAMSVTGNVAHAVLDAPADTVALAAGAALVPPVVVAPPTRWRCWCAAAPADSPTGVPC